MSRYESREDNGKQIDPDNRIIARTTDTDFYLVINREAPKAARYEIRSKSKPPLSLSADSTDHAVDSLRQWATDNKRCLLTYHVYNADEKKSQK